MGHIRCDESPSRASTAGGRRRFRQGIPLHRRRLGLGRTRDRAHWLHYWDCRSCSYPERTGDLRSIVKISDFYSARQWHTTGMYSDIDRPRDTSIFSCCACPSAAAPTAGPGRTVRLYFLPRARAGFLRA